MSFARAPRKPIHRTRLPASYQPTVPAIGWTATIVSLKARMTCTLPVNISDVPTGITVQGLPPTAVTQVSAQVFDLTYAANVVSTNVIVVPPGVPQIRAASGGTLAAGQFTFP